MKRKNKLNKNEGITGTASVFDNPERYMTDNLCPICQKHFEPAEYLKGGFADDPKALFIANLVIHYRQEHINWFEAIEGIDAQKKYRWYKGDDMERRRVNESSKRQIIRKATEVLIALGITSETFKALGYTAPMTLELAEKKLDKPISSSNLKN